ncbi:hypothetical protein NT90_04565 [Acinetobacter baumannii]|uniref:hypothetical protein n=1 Tax=Acinetobacter sp. WA-87 TaxID=3153556 RepID=UPI000575AC75|nr:hypothetical protein NT90_04565 [Acinetobacter baumannii]
MTVTKVLQEQTGIQYQGVQDKSETDPRDTLSNAIFTAFLNVDALISQLKLLQVISGQNWVMILAT